MTLTIVTFFAHVFVVRHQMSFFLFLCLSSGLIRGLLETKEPLQQTTQCSTSQIP
jgi:hypothetical protein